MAIAGDVMFGSIASGIRPQSDAKSRSTPPPEPQRLVTAEPTDKPGPGSSSTARSRGSRSSTARMQAELEKREQDHEKQLDAMGGRIEQLEAMLLAQAQTGQQMQQPRWGVPQYGGAPISNVGQGMMTEQLFAEATARAEAAGRMAMLLQPLPNIREQDKVTHLEALLFAAKHMQQQQAGAASQIMFGAARGPDLEVAGRGQLPVPQLGSAVTPAEAADAEASQQPPAPTLPAPAEPQGEAVWEHFVDPNTGRIWFWNNKTGESLFASSRSGGGTSRRRTSRRSTDREAKDSDGGQVVAAAAAALVVPTRDVSFPCTH